MSGNRKPVVCWDTCLFLAFYKRETDKPLADMRMVLQEVRDGKCRLLLSAITITEVLNTHASARTQLEKLCRDPRVEVANVDIRIATRAARIREMSMNPNNQATGGGKLRTPDAIIAATALQYEAAVLHSFDPDLTAWSRHQIINGLHVGPPVSTKGQLSLLSNNSVAELETEGL